MVGQGMYGLQAAAMACRCAGRIPAHGGKAIPETRQALLGQHPESLALPPEMWLADALNCSLHELVGILEDVLCPLSLPHRLHPYSKIFHSGQGNAYELGLV